MPQLVKSGTTLWKYGSYFLGYSRTWVMGNPLNPITSTMGTLSGSCGVVIDYPSTSFPNGRIFVTNYTTSTLSIINYSNPYAGSPTVITTAQGLFNNPISLAIDYPSTAFPNGRIFVLNNGSNNSISVLSYTNPAVGATSISTTQAGLADSRGIAVDAANNRIFVTNRASNTISILNYSIPTVILNTITQSQGNFSSPYGIALDAANARIFVANSVDNTISILNYSTPTVTAPIKITTTQGKLLGSTGIALDAPNNRIYVNNSDNTISIINYLNPSAGSPTIISATQNGTNNSQGIAIDVPGNRIFIGNYGSSSVSVLTYNFT